MNDATIALACETIGKAVTRLLESDLQAPQKFSALAGKHLLINSTAPRFTVALLFTDHQLIILPSAEHSAPAMLTGTAPALIRLLLAGNIQAAEKCQVDVSDEDQLIATLLNLSRNINIDWEALLAEHTGDIAAHFVGKSLRKALQLQQDIVTRSRGGWATYKADANTTGSANQQKENGKTQSPLDLIGAQLKALLP